MTGETNLGTLLASLSPRLNPGRFVFCNVPQPSVVQMAAALGSFREAEGTTLIIAREEADRLGLAYDYLAAWITLEVHSSLAAVGLTAAFATALAKQGISCNVIAGYHHDHLFVAEADAERAVAVLQQLAAESR
ncbi:ACT domain-containing protein [Pseudomonas sp. Gutcm_11s]|uniref:ACT domain-containing protein n=1 Tax=Pseudomonas sp. Gutcm_11s TaxID=3026088 RepID=UPI00235E07C7|nr:ACT domain-containing protein [Pseudomonas sp. Gutcm_11s]MDD0841790.1 ACT domain-containing protein [Pseudomonas sp. Gutcm_11s]